MANHAYIIDAENNLETMDEGTAREVASNFIWESEAEGTGHPYPENRDCWGTLWVNATILLPKNPALAYLVSVLNTEFLR
jgi:hypothetical protein